MKNRVCCKHFHFFYFRFVVWRGGSGWLSAYHIHCRHHHCRLSAEPVYHSKLHTPFGVTSSLSWWWKRSTKCLVLVFSATPSTSNTQHYSVDIEIERGPKLSSWKINPKLNFNLLRNLYIFEFDVFFNFFLSLRLILWSQRQQQQHRIWNDDDPKWLLSFFIKVLTVLN